jgi:hypothetical protein
MILGAFVRIFRLIVFLVFSELVVAGQAALSAPPSAFAVNDAPSSQVPSALPSGSSEPQHGSGPPIRGTDVPQSDAQKTETTASEDPPSMFNHPDSSRFWISGQANFIYH